MKNRTKIDVPWERPTGKNKHYQTDGPKERIRFLFRSVLFQVSPMREVGITTGRTRFKVECVTCGEVLHKSTTGPASYCESHFDQVHRKVREGQPMATPPPITHTECPRPGAHWGPPPAPSLFGTPTGPDVAAVLGPTLSAAAAREPLEDDVAVIGIITGAIPVGHPAVMLAKDGEAAVRLVNYPAGVYLEYRDASGRMIYSERFENIVKIAFRLVAGKIGTPS